MTNHHEPGNISHSAMHAARRLTPKLALAVGLVYVGFSALYASRLTGAGNTSLVSITAFSAVALLSCSAVFRRRSPTLLQTHLLIGGMGGLVILNVAAEYAVSGVYIHGVGFAFAQIAAAVLLPTLRWMVTFTIAILLAWLATTVAAGIPVPAQEVVLCFSATTLVAAVVFYSRMRSMALVESLRVSLEESRDNDLRQIIEKNPDAVLLHRHGEIVYANASLAGYLKFDRPDRLVGTQLAALVAPEGAQDLEILLADETGVATYTLEFVRTDDQRIVVEFSEPRTIRFEQTTAVLLIGRDITASREALHAKLLVADRMAVAGTLAAGLAHEINNPLAYIGLNLASLKGALPNPTANVLEMVDEISEGVGRVASIVNHLEAISPDADHGVTAVDATRALEHAIELASNEIRHRAEIIHHLVPIPWVAINRGKLIQVFAKLLINAARAVESNPHGPKRITVTTSVDEAGRPVVEVGDSGECLPADVRQRIFEPFFTHDSTKLGAGLGLFYCHNVVTAAAGTIEVSSGAVSGNTFRVAFPPAKDQRPSVSVGSTVAPKVVRGALQILVIDDEPFVGRAIQRVLADCVVTVSTSGADGIARCEELRPDLVLCDIMMPGIPGPVVFDRIRERDPELSERIVFMTGGAFTKPTREFVETTNNRVLKKPVDIATLFELVAEHERLRSPTAHINATGTV